MTRRDLLAEARRLLALAWPVAVTNLQWILLNLTDTALVGRYSTNELGSLGAGRAITWVAVVMGVAGLTGILVHAGRADGAGERTRAGEAFRQGVLLAALYGALMCVVVLLSADVVVTTTDVAPELRSSATDFAHIIAFALPFQLVFAAGSYFMEGISRPRLPMAVNLASLPLNGLLAWGFIGGHLGLAPMGAAGAALGTALTSVLSCATLLWLIHRMPDAAEFGVATRERFAVRWHRAWTGGAELRRFAVAPAVAAGFELAGFSILTVVSAQGGGVVASAFQAAIALHLFSLAAATGLASAAGVRTANAVGEGRPDAARSRTFIACGLAAVTLLAFSAAYMAFAPALLAPFSADPAVVSLGASMLRIFAPFLVADGIQFVFLFCLRSLGDQKAAGIISSVAFFGVMGLGGAWLYGPGGMGPLGLAAGVSAGIVAGVIGLGGRFLWRTRAPTPRLPQADLTLSRPDPISIAE